MKRVERSSTPEKSANTYGRETRVFSRRPEMASSKHRAQALICALFFVGCDANDSRSAIAEAPACANPTVDAGPSAPVDDELDPLRRLRRMTLALTDRLPTRERLYELDAIEDRAAQDAWLDAEAERLLSGTAFYDAMVEFGHAWMSIPMDPVLGANGGYYLHQQSHIIPCPEGSLHEGRWSSPHSNLDNRPCNGLSWDGTPAVVRTIEPWWAEGTTIEVVGLDGNENPIIEGPGGRPVDCGNVLEAGVSTERESDAEHPGGECGCGPHLSYCYPESNYSFVRIGHPGNDKGVRRRAWDEPARLFAHLAWHDRSLTDLIAGTYSVGPVGVQAMYVRYGRRLGATALDEDESWWRASRWTAPHDPHHEATDPDGWSEFDISSRNPFLLRERDYHFDPRTQARGEMRGVPAAGVMTMPGVLAAFSRERIRGARFLEMFACENFVPPSPTAHFEPYTNDPAAGGPCMHCHARIDPASIHFKRFINVSGLPNSGYQILGAGDSHLNPLWMTGAFPYFGEPFGRMRRLWIPGTRMTPIDEATAMAEPESRYIDFLPPDQTLYGQVSDGTVGPLGLAKMLINSGAFDRCAVRRLHEHFVGRDVDPTAEAGYLEALVDVFVENNRQIRPFVRELFKGELFRRGL
jgi:hypothetical protein